MNREVLTSCLMALGLAANTLSTALYPFGWTELHIAILYHHSEIEKVEKLLVSGYTIDTQDKTGWTPLHYAAVWGYLTCVKALVEHGANIFLKTNDQETAEALARKWQYHDIAHYLEIKREEQVKQQLHTWRERRAKQKRIEIEREYQEDLERAFNRTRKKYEDRHHHE
ncbi:ankyrin repeat domain-containing protein [bacterium]|nr:MAG: ankyrin repeat domain-containing protein [bacterium]